MAPAEIKSELRKQAIEEGFQVCRVTTAATPESAQHLRGWLKAGRHGEMGYMERTAAKRLDPQLVLPGAKAVVVVAMSYGQPKGDARAEQPANVGGPRGQVARYAQYDDYHDVLGEKLKRLAQGLAQWGGGKARSLWYVDTGPVLERAFAEQAGAGFIGKHTNLISRALGNWIFLGEILTSLELPPDEPEKNRCGCCTRCLEACPTQAITAPFQLDARHCISYLTIELKGSIPVDLRPLLGNRIYGCDDCLAACPWNRFAQESREMRQHARTDLAQPELLALLTLDEAGFQQRFAGSPILRAKRRGLLRNVCVALGNIGDESALPDLRKAAAEPEPLIAEHAVWAIAQIEARRDKAQPRPNA